MLKKVATKFNRLLKNNINQKQEFAIKDDL